MAWALPAFGEDVGVVAALECLAASASAELHRSGSSFGEQSLSNIAYGFARAEHRATALFTSLGDAASLRLATKGSRPFTEQELSNLSWAFGKMAHPHPTLQRSLASHVAERVTEFSPQGLSNIIWSWSQLGAPDPALLKTVVVEATRRAREFSPQSATMVMRALPALEGALCESSMNLLHALSDVVLNCVSECVAQDVASAVVAWAKVEGDQPRLPFLAALGRRATEVVDEFSPQGLANMLWAFARLKHQPRAHQLSVLLRQAEQSATKFKAQEVCNVLWALSTLQVDEDGGCVASLSCRVSALAAEFNADDTANAVLGLAKLRHSLDAELRRGLARAVVRTLEDMHPQQVAYTAWGAAKLDLCQCAHVSQKLTARIRDVLGEMHAQSLGMSCWALAVIGPPCDSEERHKVAKHMKSQVTACVGEMGWQTIAHIEFFLECWELPASRLRGQLTERTGTEMDAVARHRDEHLDAVGRAACEAAETASQSLGTGSTVLLVGMVGSRVLSELHDAGFETAEWDRFTSGKRLGVEWPPKKKCDGCIARVPISGEALRMTLDAVASRLKAAAPLWLVGLLDEGPGAARRALEPLFELRSTISATDSAFTVAATRVVPGEQEPVRRRLSAWADRAILEVDGEAISWTVYPGLFAGGTLDVMTSFLLETLPKPPEGCQVLDFASGSGVIGGTLSRRTSSICLTLTDADAVALRAATVNVPGAATILTDCWRGVPKLNQFNWIVSNPPVHRGKLQDFSVVEALIKGSSKRLAAGGVLWTVVQHYVPFGRLLELHAPSCFNARLHSNDRFAVWEACLVSSTTVRQELCKRVHGDVEGVHSVKKRARTDTS